MELRKGDRFKFTYSLINPYWIYNEILDIRIYTKDEARDYFINQYGVENMRNFPKYESNHFWQIGKTCCLVVDRDCRSNGLERERMWIEAKMLEECIDGGLEGGRTIYLGNMVEDRQNKIDEILKW